MIKYLYIFLLSITLISCTTNTGKNDIESINLDNDEIINELTGTSSFIDKTTSKEVDELIDILFETNY